MRLFAVFLLLIALPVASAQEGLFVSQHNVTFTLGTDDFSVEEVIVFENVGSASGNLFKDVVFFTRGDASDVKVEVAPEDQGYSVRYLDPTRIDINLLFWRGEKRTVTLRYNRSDMLFTEDTVHTISGLALGTYSWIADGVRVKFIAPEGFQFGNVAPPGTKTTMDSKEVLTYELTPIDLENLTTIREGIPVRLEYAKFDELAINEMKTAKDFISDAEADISGANKTIENALGQVPDTTQILTLFEIASTTLEEAKNALELAEIKSNQYSEEYSPYEAYYYASASRNLSREASRKAGEAKDLANHQIQVALEDKISGIGEKIKEGAEGVTTPKPEVDWPFEAGLPAIGAGWGIAFVLILAAAVIFDIYRRSGGYRRAPPSKKSRVGDFRAIDDLKRKTFNGFDKKLDTVKIGTGLAAEIRDLRKKKEERGFERDKLQRKMEREEISQHQFEIESEELSREINETSSKIDELKSRLDELKRSNK